MLWRCINRERWVAEFLKLWYVDGLRLHYNIAT
jgi:hypothetical protein